MNEKNVKLKVNEIDELNIFESIVSSLSINEISRMNMGESQNIIEFIMGSEKFMDVVGIDMVFDVSKKISQINIELFELKKMYFDMLKCFYSNKKFQKKMKKNMIKKNKNKVIENESSVEGDNESGESVENDDYVVVGIGNAMDYAENEMIKETNEVENKKNGECENENE